MLCSPLATAREHSQDGGLHTWERRSAVTQPNLLEARPDLGG